MALLWQICQKKKYRFIDAANILVEPLSEEEMMEILKKANEA